MVPEILTNGGGTAKRRSKNKWKEKIFGRFYRFIGLNVLYRRIGIDNSEVIRNAGLKAFIEADIAFFAVIFFGDNNFALCRFFAVRNWSCYKRSVRTGDTGKLYKEKHKV